MILSGKPDRYPEMPLKPPTAASKSSVCKKSLIILISAWLSGRRNNLVLTLY